MQASEKYINQILHTGVRYVVPRYQRPYSWTDYNTEQLLEDIHDSWKAGDNEYFIGSLILTESGPNGSQYDIVDGQQRLTTLLVIFSAIKALLEADDQKNYISNFLVSTNPMTGVVGAPILLVRDQDRQFFLDHILLGREDLVTSDLTVSQQNFINNRKKALSFLSLLSQKDLASIAIFIETKVSVVCVSANSFKSAFRLFNVLNARGLKLSNSDLIKNSLFCRSENDTAAQDAIEEFWNELEELLGTSIDGFLGHYRTSLLANKQEEDLHSEYEQLLEKNNDGAGEFTRRLVKAAGIYNKITSNSFVGHKDCTTISRSVASLLNVSYDEWIPPLLAFIDSGYNDLSIAEFSNLLERITYQNWIRRLGRAKRNQTYYKTISLIRQGKSADEIVMAFSGAANNEELLEFLSRDIYGTPYAKAVMIGLEEHTQDYSVTKSYSGIISIEHILPQKASDSYWTDRFKPDEHNLWVHKLGNLTLLSGRKNPAAQNYPFPRKKEIYNENGNKVSFDLTKEVCSLIDWDVDALKNRQADLIARAKNRWAI